MYRHRLDRPPVRNDGNRLSDRGPVDWTSETVNTPGTQVASGTAHPGIASNSANSKVQQDRSVQETNAQVNRNHHHEDDLKTVVSQGSTHAYPRVEKKGIKVQHSVPVATRSNKSFALKNLMEIARPTNRPRFQLTYDVEAIALADIKEVSLWMTHDGGQNWRKWGIDTDRQSPFPVEVNQPGIYGFRIVISSRDGINSRVPRGGEAADLWVRYDPNAPTIRITAVPYGRGEEAGKLVIQWQASDEQLTLRPISLAYSNAVQGPWTDIEKGLRNQGRYVWKVPPQVPELVYLRIQALDTAGNRATFTLDQPINLANLIPKGRIKGMVPLGPRQTTDQSPKRH